MMVYGKPGLVDAQTKGALMTGFTLKRFGGLAFALVLLLTATANAETEIHSLTGVIEGHQVGGVTIDLIGNIYVADFADDVWKITPEGDRQLFATGLYGSSGNVIDHEGNLLQSSYYGDTITRIDRKGNAKPFVTAAGGLSGPVGLAINAKTGDVYAANCRGNSIVKISSDGTVSPFATSALFHCPNGVTFDRDGNLYVVDFSDNKMFKVGPSGSVAPFATVSSKGLGHVCFKDDRLYVAAYHTHEIYEITLKGGVKRILGNGERGMVDGGPDKARLSFPNGIGCDPWYPRLYVNESLGESESSLPRRTIVRKIDLEPQKQATATAASAGNACCAVFELRQYTLRPGQRDTLIDLFDREFVESQEALGMRIDGQFRDVDNPDHFVWIRAFADMDARLQGLTSFYGGSLWKAYSKQANATMVDTDNVLLLHPVDPRGGFNDLPAERAPPDTTTSPDSLVVATIYNLQAGAERAFPGFFRESLRPALLGAGITPRATFETEHSPNNFPGLPVRADANVFVWIASYDTTASYAERTAQLSKSHSWAKLRSKLASYLTSPPQDLHLRPTARSLLR